MAVIQFRDVQIVILIEHFMFRIIPLQLKVENLENMIKLSFT